MTKIAFKEYICRPYCMFFRDGEKEDMSCHGAVIMERLVAMGKIDSERLPLLEKVEDIFKKADNNLQTHVCGNCPFRDEDCDFQDISGSASSEPCGGYILLTLLKDKNLLTDKDIVEACSE